MTLFGGDLEECVVELSIATRSVAEYEVIEVSGEIDVYTAPDLRQTLAELSDQGKHRIIVDMAGVDFLDSTGLGVLVGALKRAKAVDGSLRLVCDHERILKIFRITGLEKVFKIYSSVVDAVDETNTSKAE